MKGSKTIEALGAGILPATILALVALLICGWRDALGQCPAGATCRLDAWRPVPPTAMHPVHVRRWTTAPPAATTAADPLARINAHRARHGLGALAFDPNLAAAASINNGACLRRGMGHHVRPPVASQCVAGTADPGHAVRLWMASPPHRAILLGPSARSIGLAFGDGYATANVSR